MSKIWYDCNVKFRKTTETGAQKVVTQSYLVDALSYTEAESRINEKMCEYINEEFKVTNIKVTNFQEVYMLQSDDAWFKAKVSLMAYDEESGKERKTNMYLLIQASDAKDAYENTVLAMKGTMGDYYIPMVSETKIIDVFPYLNE